MNLAARDDLPGIILDRFSLVVVALLILVLSGCSSMAPSTTSTAPLTTPPGWRYPVPVGGVIQPPSGMSRDQAIAEITSRSVLLLGTPYRLGGSRPSEGLDCSGLIAHVVEEAFRLRCPRTTEEQALVGSPVSRRSLAPGDLVFFNTTGRPNSHVGVYLGESRFVHAPTSRGVVRIESLEQGYWSRRFDQARRLIL